MYPGPEVPALWWGEAEAVRGSEGCELLSLEKEEGNPPPGLLSSMLYLQRTQPGLRSQTALGSDWLGNEVPMSGYVRGRLETPGLGWQETFVVSKMETPRSSIA